MKNKAVNSSDSRQVVTSITAGLVVGLIVIVFSISLASLIFSGEMSPYLSRGIGLFLFCGLGMWIVVPVFGSLPGTWVGPPDGPPPSVAVCTGGTTLSLLC